MTFTTANMSQRALSMVGAVFASVLFLSAFVSPLGQLVA